MIKIYIPKSSICLWFMIGFFFVYKYIFEVMDFNDMVGSINNDTLLFTIFLYSILAAILSIIYMLLISLIKDTLTIL